MDLLERMIPGTIAKVIDNHSVVKSSTKTIKYKQELLIKIAEEQGISLLSLYEEMTDLLIEKYGYKHSESTFIQLFESNFNKNLEEYCSVSRASAAANFLASLKLLDRQAYTNALVIAFKEDFSKLNRADKGSVIRCIEENKDTIDEIIVKKVLEMYQTDQIQEFISRITI